MLQQPLVGKSGFEKMILSCKVDGDPVLIIQWKFNGKNLEPTGRYFETLLSGSSTLAVNRTTLADEGIYRCEATNSFGTIFDEIIVKFNRKFFTIQ